MSQPMSVKLFMICTGTRKTGNCHVAFVYYVLFIFCVKFQTQFCFQSWTNSPVQVSYFICQTPTHYQWHLIIPVLKGWWQNKREHRSCRKGFNCIWDHLLFYFSHPKNLTITHLLVYKGIIEVSYSPDSTPLSGQNFRTESCLIYLILKEISRDQQRSLIFLIREQRGTAEAEEKPEDPTWDSTRNKQIQTK